MTCPRFPFTMTIVVTVALEAAAVSANTPGALTTGWALCLCLTVNDLFPARSLE